MPRKYDLTWIAHAKRWRKRYRGQTFYLKTNVNGKKDRQGYLAAVAEWERVKAHVDGLGPNPYTATGVLIPPESSAFQSVGAFSGQSSGVFSEPVETPQLSMPNDPPWILSRGIAAALHPKLIVRAELPSYGDERRVSAQVTSYLDSRRKEADRGQLSLMMYDEDKRQVETFRDFLNVNYPSLAFVDQISPQVLNVYRDRQNTVCRSTQTLKKRLGGVRKWLLWLVDQNVLRELPKDMTTYAKVKAKKPTPAFFSVEQVKAIHAKSSGVFKACVLLGLNAGFTQQDCSTLTPEMIDWETGILTRDRSKTGCDQRAKLWPETLAALRAVGQFKGGPLFVTPTGKPLVVESVNPKNDKVVKVDHVQKCWKKLIHDPGKSFKHLRKTSANYIESWNPALTGLFLAHAERGVKRHYVARHFDELFALTDKLRETYKLASQSE